MAVCYECVKCGVRLWISAGDRIRLKAQGWTSFMVQRDLYWKCGECAGTKR